MLVSWRSNDGTSLFGKLFFLLETPHHFFSFQTVRFFWDPPRGFFAKLGAPCSDFGGFGQLYLQPFSSEHLSSPSPKEVTYADLLGIFLLKCDFWRRKKEDVDMDEFTFDFEVSSVALASDFQRYFDKDLCKMG